jgi:hypothetical protein
MAMHSNLKFKFALRTATLRMAADDIESGGSFAEVMKKRIPYPL